MTPLDAGRRRHRKPAAAAPARQAWLRRQRAVQAQGLREKWGLGTGLLLSVIGLIIWIFVPARAESPWRQKQARKAAAVDAADLADDRK